MSFFGKMKSKYLPIPDDKRIVTLTFLKASDDITVFFEKFNNAFSPVKKDVIGNIMKIRTQYEKNPEKYVTINDILEETGAKGDKDLTNAHIGVVWLIRGLDFIQKLLDLIVKDYAGDYDAEGTMKNVVQGAYSETLSKHHNLLMKGVFKAVSLAAPYKKEFMGKLREQQDVTKDQAVSLAAPDKKDKLREQQDVTNDQVIADMEEYHICLAETVVVVQGAIDALGVKG